MQNLLWQAVWRRRPTGFSKIVSSGWPSVVSIGPFPSLDQTKWYSRSVSRQASFSDGEGVYKQAVRAMQEAKETQDKKEKERSQRMFEAWQKSQEEGQNTKSQGVTVVKTLVKETRKEKMGNKAAIDGIMQRAIDLLEQAAHEYQHPEALVQLGNFALERAGASELRNDAASRSSEVRKAVDLFERAGLAGSKAGWYNLGQIYWTGYPVVESGDDGDDNAEMPPSERQLLTSDLPEAMDAFARAIDLGDTDSMYLVGVHRMTSGGRENIHSGIRLVERAAEGGHGGALYYLALLHLNGEPNTGLKPCSEDDFVQRLDRAAETGNVDALFVRGHSYYHGTEGYPQNRMRALQDFLQGAEGDHADAAVSAGAMLHAGVGVAKDQQKAFQLYQTGGELGSKEGWRNVVACYTTGEGVPKSLETARYIAETMLTD